jgi:polyhydroxybutyrate depolymerase
MNPISSLATPSRNARSFGNWSSAGRRFGSTLLFFATTACSSTNQQSATDGTPAAGSTSSLGGSVGAGGAIGSGAAGSSGIVGAGGVVTGAGGIVVGGASGSGGYGLGPSGGAFGVGGVAGFGGTTNTGGAAGGATNTGGVPSVSACGASSMLTPGETTATIQVGGVTRSYILHVPSKYDGQAPVPLVLDFHPILSNATFERTASGYATLSDQEGFIVAFPEGIDAAWNVGPCCTMSRTVDDVGFAKALVAKLESQGCIDPKRVYATGFSMGGGMSHMLACNAADVFAAVAPSAFDLLEESEEPCHPARPISEITFRGTADPIVPYAGGASRPPNGLNVTIHFLGAVGTFQKWAGLDGCTGSPSAPDSNGCQTYAQCQAGVEVTLCTTQGGSHTTGSATIGWATLKRHTLP